MKNITDPMFVKLSNEKMNNVKGGAGDGTIDYLGDRTYVTINTDQCFYGDGTNAGKCWIIDCVIQ